MSHGSRYAPGRYQASARIVCPACGIEVQEHPVSGTFRRHGPRSKPCSASGMDVEQWLRAERYDEGADPDAP